MNMRAVKKGMWIGLAALAAGAVLWKAFQPSPMAVELGAVTRGRLEVTVDEQGETRAHDRYTIAAPVSGRLDRMPWREGDRVRAGQQVATIYPLPADPRERTEAQEKLKAAEALERQAAAAAAHAQADHDQARRDRGRAEELGREGIIARQVLEQAQTAEASAERDLAAARFRTEAAAADVKAARAAVESHEIHTSKPVPVRSPVSGRVMRIPDPSERVVAAGASLMTLGDAAKLEVVVDLLSSDAVKVAPGAEARLVNWGGPHALRAKVRVVEPSGFTKVSALGVEEQRVNVVLDFVDPPGPLSDGYRVETQIVTWRAEDVVQVPGSALFRCGELWCVFAAEQGIVRRVAVEPGHRSEREVEILGGIEPGARVVLHPPNTLQSGARVLERNP